MLGVPILIFQPCNNLAGYICVEAASPVDDENTNFNKIICLTKNDVYFDMLVVLDSKEIPFNKKIFYILSHNFHFEINTFFKDLKVTSDSYLC